MRRLLWRTLLAERTGLVLLAPLLATDLALIAANILHDRAVLADERFTLGHERGCGEMFEYAKLAATATLLAWFGVRWRSLAGFFWAALFAYLVIDNAFAVHEWMGVVIAGRVPLPRIGTVRPVDFGELIFFAAIGGIAGLAIAAILRFASSPARPLTWLLGAGLLVLALFGVGVDLVHRMVRRTWLEPTVAVVEEGGELVVSSVLLWMAWWVNRRPGVEDTSMPEGSITQSRDQPE
jgi:hypothetical protein